MPSWGNEERISNTVVWLTPPYILEALGEFDLDPCAATNRPWDTAKNHYIEADDGLAKPWFGRVWMNPPYGNTMHRWMGRLRDHGNGIALIFARTETQVFFDSVWEHADAILFLKGRIKFVDETGAPGNSSSGAPSVLVAYGKENAEVLKNCGLPGKFISLA